jgi:hypothetical protein
MKKILTFLIIALIAIPVSAQLSGVYYIPQGSNPQGFATLADAFTAVNTQGLSGTVTFLIDDNLNEIGANLVLYRGDLSATNNLIIKPAPTKTPTINLTGCVTAGHQSYAGITIDSTSYVTIDGSNTIGGGTQDLTLQMSDGTNGRIIIQAYGNADNITIKNCILKYAQVPAGPTTSRGIYVNGQSTGVTDNFVVENCLIGDGTNDPAYCVSITGSSTGPIYCSNIIVKNNILYGTLRRVYFFNVGTSSSICEVSGNTIYGLNPAASGNVVWGILFNTYGGTINVFNNKLHSLRSVTTGTEGIYAFGTLNGLANVVLNIYNNFFGGDFVHSGTGIPASIDVISFQDAPTGATVNLYYNTAVLNNMTKQASGRMTCLRFNPVAGSTFNIKNNIFVNHRDSSVARAIYFGGTAVTFNSNYNDIYVSGANANVGYFNGSNQPTLADWQSVTLMDSMSLSINPQLVSLTDFHLSTTSTPVLGKGIEIPGITTDIDGQVRDSIPEIGADEYPGIIPVELVSFAANVADGKVKLSWATASEKNNSGFEIQRCTNSDFKTIGFVEGKGTSTERNSYSFVDDNPGFGVVKYRLKQIDFNGTYSYSNIIEVDVSSPVEFNLAQNYPNPFNPTTTIRYTIAKAANVSLVVYNVLGEEILTLVNNQFTEPGVYNVVFDATNLASGTYIYRLTADDFVMTKKMVLTK